VRLAIGAAAAASRKAGARLLGLGRGAGSLVSHGLGLGDLGRGWRGTSGPKRRKRAGRLGKGRALVGPEHELGWRAIWAACRGQREKVG